MAAGDKLQRGAAERQRIDAGMRAEAAVFIGQQQLEIAGIDVGPGIDRQPPAAIRHGIGAQQLAVAVSTIVVETSRACASGNGASAATQVEKAARTQMHMTANAAAVLRKV